MHDVFHWWADKVRGHKLVWLCLDWASKAYFIEKLIKRGSQKKSMKV